MGYNREDYEPRNPKQYRVELYIESDCPLTKEEAKNFVSRIKSKFKDEDNSLNCCVQTDKSRGKTRINNMKFKDVYIKEQ